MTNEISKASGMVISSMPAGEYDKRIVLLTKEYGRITVFARGAKRPKSAYGAACEPFSMGEYYLYRGKSAYNLQKAQVSDYFTELRLDLDAIWLGSYFLEVAEYYSRENQDESELLNLIYISLKALTDDRFDNNLVRAVFELKALCINGEQPDLSCCAECSGTENLIRFVSHRNGCLCSGCADCDGFDKGIEISQAALYAMRFVEESPIRTVFSFSADSSVIGEFSSCMKDYYKRWVERRFRTLKAMGEDL